MFHVEQFLVSLRRSSSKDSSGQRSPWLVKTISVVKVNEAGAMLDSGMSDQIVPRGTIQCRTPAKAQVELSLKRRPTKTSAMSAALESAPATSIQQPFEPRRGQNR